MRFLANDNFLAPSIKVLRETGIEIKSITENMPGISDKEVIQVAQKEKLIISTFHNPPAVIFFRFKETTPAFAGNL